MRIVLRGITAAAFAFSTTLVLAQGAGQRDPNMPDPKNVPAEKMKPAEPSSTGTSGPSLSDKLERTDGVIKPPANVDPDITTRPPVPNPGSMIVIPPPGSPGGNENVQPK